MENVENTVNAENTQTAADQSITGVDAAIAAAKQRKAAKVAGAPAVPAAPSSRPRLSDEDRKARNEKLEIERAARKVERDAKRVERLASRAAAAKPAHLAKVQAAEARLGTLSEDAQLIFNEAITNLSAAALTILAGHMAHFCRKNSTLMALSAKPEVGQRVTITGGDPRFIGKVGTVNKVQRIRCYVQLDGVEKVHYCFTSDVAPVAVPVEEPVAAAV